MRKIPVHEKLLKKFSSVQLLALSFFFVILIGSILLSLPIANNRPIQSYLNNLFISVSAVCVTGLTPIVVADQYSAFGLTVMILLMQIGGLGLMTFLALFMTAMRRKMNLAEKQLLLDATSKTDMARVPEYVQRIIKYTLFFEGTGWLILCIRLIPDYGIGRGIFYSLYLAVSAFCNAGFDPIGAQSIARYVTDPLVSLTIMVLIVTGGLGFIVWFDIRNHIKEKRRGTRYNLKTLFQHLRLHTKIVLGVTLGLLISGTLLILILEYNNPETLGNLNFGQKLLASAFQSVTLRTAGFSTINIAACWPATLFLMCIYMLIGGSPGGTAGGIKTTTFASLLLLTRSSLHGEDHMNCYKREVGVGAFIKGISVFSLYLLALCAAITIMCVTEGGHLSFLQIFFECFSAIGTVGLSAGATPMLSAGGKIVIMCLMFIGRIGPITLLLSFMKNSHRRYAAVTYPDEDIIIG